MKFARGLSTGDEFEINVISLIDVMLVLLMFFVMTATFEKRAIMRVALPEAASTATTVEQDALALLIDADGRVYLGSNEVLNPNVDTIKSALVAVAGEDRERAIHLRADGRTPHQSVVTAMDALAQLGFSRLSIVTTPSKSEGSQ